MWVTWVSCLDGWDCGWILGLCWMVALCGLVYCYCCILFGLFSLWCFALLCGFGVAGCVGFVADDWFRLVLVFGFDLGGGDSCLVSLVLIL